MDGKPPSPAAPALIRQAETPEDLAAIAECFHAYAEWLNEDLSHQNYAQEVASLPGKYSPPAGHLLLALDPDSGASLGCVALRPLELPASHVKAKDGHRCAEMKRLFVYPEARGRQVARQLVLELLARADKAGYHEVFLDSLIRMEPAINLYRSVGFVDASAYNDYQYVGIVYFSKEL